ncbi:hypothetical protein H2200_006865 [Cladophialophora chaetospira]|uniref:Elongator complex protein 6 n=1 Tax=Cladophialophora chaetospira TaxID=386627 RepID=A0AA38X971_9EURO|nr:hypothetical protein H2200_006865 [Cladophialophora chaetospira]
MPPAIPPPLAAYLESSISSPHSQILITSVLSTPPTWLLLRLIYVQLHGVGDDSDNQQLPRRGSGRPESGERKILFVSLTRPLSLWTEMGKKMGLDFHSLLKSGKIIYIDGLGYGSLAPRKDDASLLPMLPLRGLTLDYLEHALDSALASVSTNATASMFTSSEFQPKSRFAAFAPSYEIPEDFQPHIIIDGLDFLLASQPSLTTVSVQALLSEFRTRSRDLVLTCNADGPLLQTATSANHDTGTPLERNHAHFLTSMAHQSRWVSQLRGLDTGSAKDVSGVVRVSRGGAADDDEITSTTGSGLPSHDLADGEWLYHLKADGSVRVWSRGE